MRSFTALLISLCMPAFADNLHLTLKSKVELRNWKLSTRAFKQEKFLTGASVKLYQGSAFVSETKSGPDGDFELNLPSSGTYTIEITYPGHNPKKFAVHTRSIPAKTGDIPIVEMTGIIMQKTIKTTDDLGLHQPLVKIEKENSNAYHMRSLIYDADYLLIQKFCTANKLGDMALENKNYTLAKAYYLTAIDLMNGESYPKERLVKAEEGLKLEKGSRTKQKSKVKPTKNNMPKQKTSSKAVKSTDLKNSGEKSGSGRKIPKPLGSK